MPTYQPWLKNAIIYNIFIDRFARGGGEAWLETDSLKPQFCGGNLQGIIDRLDYLQRLGVNTILLTPFNPTPVYHGYQVTDFYGVEPRFGTIETLKALIDACHLRGMRILMDFVMNHVSSRHPYFVSARENKNSPYANWFSFTSWPDGYLSFLNFYEQPKLNLKNPDVRAHIVGAAQHWLELGFDGFRIDHVVGVPHEFLHEFRKAVKTAKPDAVLIGEAVTGKITWNDVKTLRLRHRYALYLLSKLGIKNSFFVQRQYVHDLDGVLDFFFRDLIESSIVKKSWIQPHFLFHVILRAHHFFTPRHFSYIPLFDNPDMDRLSYRLKDSEKQKEVTEVLLAQPHPILILYGNEAGLAQAESRTLSAKSEKPHGDAAIRGLMPWESIDWETYRYYQSLIRKRIGSSEAGGERLVIPDEKRER